MLDINRLKQTMNETDAKMQKAIGNIGVMAQDARRVSETARDAHIIIGDIDRKFEQATKLTKTDIVFLFLAVALQVARQYLVTNFKERTGYNEAAKEAKNIEKSILGKETGTKAFERKNTLHSWYHPSLQEVMFNPVPFDQTRGLEGIGGGFEHRAKTLGHDPILGYIFGTANIATATLTAWNLQSFHVKYAGTGILKPTVTNDADIEKIFRYTGERLLNEGAEGKLIIGVSLFREAMHLKSDVNSKVSLPIPAVSVISPDFAKELAHYGIDIANIKVVGKQAAYAILINTFIAMVHRLLYNEETSGGLALYSRSTLK